MSHPTSEIDLLLSYVFTTLAPSGEGPRANKSKIFTTNMSGSDCCTPKDGWHRREFYSLPLLYSTPSICSEGACTLRWSINLDIIPVTNGVSFDAAFRVSYLLPISAEACFDGFEGENQQPISFIFEQLCSENSICNSRNTIRVRESW